jgi:hypothetical protein
VTRAGSLRLHAPDALEGYTDKEIHDKQLRVAAWFVTHGGVDAGTRKKRKRLPREVIDDLQPIFCMLGLGVITDDSGLWDLIESGKFVPNKPPRPYVEVAEPKTEPTKPEPIVLDLDPIVPEPGGCVKGHSICVDCGYCVCHGMTRVTRLKEGPPLCTACRAVRKKAKK